MSWPCRAVDDINEAKKPGDMWPVKSHRGDKIDWYIRLPGGGIHNLHAVFRDGTSWQVTGEAPRFTVTPSINCYDSKDKDGTIQRKGWHGYLTDGVLTDDYEGRTYP